MQLATIGEDGKPKLRTIVLRSFDRQSATLTFITDSRSPKVREIEKHRWVSLVGFDPANTIQLRMEGEAFVGEREDHRRDLWNSLRPHTLAMFRQALGPGTALGKAANLRERTLTRQSSEQDRYNHFCVVRVRLTLLDWLDLSGETHLRYRYQRSRNGWRGYGIAP
jgi:hypothetical protein